MYGRVEWDRNGGMKGLYEMMIGLRGEGRTEVGEVGREDKEKEVGEKREVKGVGESWGEEGGEEEREGEGVGGGGVRDRG